MSDHTPAWLNVPANELPVFVLGQEAARAAYEALSDLWPRLAAFASRREAAGVYMQPVDRPHDDWGEPDATVRTRAGRRWGLWAGPIPAKDPQVAAALAAAEGPLLCLVGSDHGVCLVVADLWNPPALWRLNNPPLREEAKDE